MLIMMNATMSLGGYDVIEVVGSDEHRVVKIGPDYAPDGTIAGRIAGRTAVYEIAGTARRSKSFKTLAGATRWAKKQVGA
jgi:hypothetical protein